MGDESTAGLTLRQMSLIDGVYLSTYAVGQFVCGICGDRSGTRKVILMGMLGSVLAGLAMGASSSALLLVLMSGLQGICQSTGWAPLTKNISNFFSQRERGTIMGLWCTNYVAGGFVASIYAGYFGGLWGWRYAFFVPAVTLFGVWFLFLLLQRNRPEDIGLPPIEEYHGEKENVLNEQEAPDEEPEGSWKVIAEVLRSPMV